MKTRDELMIDEAWNASLPARLVDYEMEIKTFAESLLYLEREGWYQARARTGKERRMKWKLVPVAADMTDDIAEAIALEAKCCGGIAHTIYVKALAAAPNALTAAEERAAETLALLNAEIAKHQWKPIEEAPKDGTIIWAKFRNDIYQTICPDRKDLERWNGVQVPLKFDGMYWGVAAPVGMGGFPDEWIEGWVNTPEAPRTEDGK